MSRFHLTFRVAVLGLLAAGCSVQDTPTALPSGLTPSGLASVSPSRGPEAQDPCTQVALTRLDGQLGEEPSAPPTALVRANEVVAEFVERYDKVLVASGVDAARAALAADVGAACKIPAGEGNVVQIPVDPAPAASPTG
ncbi:MAG: hypothetical protein H7323_12310 [Frankiales bacterium]|nr:hypothetical protein [Frankiales bacterium]